MEENEKTETEAFSTAEETAEQGVENLENVENAENAENTLTAEENEEDLPVEAEYAQGAPGLSAEEFARTLANPMFAFFARGRAESAEILAQEFEKMLAAGKSTLSEEALMKMTPSAGFSAVGGVALSERQRKIARDAGMSYREYYEIIRTIPTRTK